MTDQPSRLTRIPVESHRALVRAAALLEVAQEIANNFEGDLKGLDALIDVIAETLATGMRDLDPNVRAAA